MLCCVVLCYVVICLYNRYLLLCKYYLNLIDQIVVGVTKELHYSIFICGSLDFSLAWSAHHDQAFHSLHHDGCDMLAAQHVHTTTGVVVKDIVLYCNCVVNNTMCCYAIFNFYFKYLITVIWFYGIPLYVCCCVMLLLCSCWLHYHSAKSFKNHFEDKTKSF